MPDVKSYLRPLDEAEAPDVWLDAETREPHWVSSPPTPSHRRMPVTLLALVLAGAATFVLLRAFAHGGSATTGQPISLGAHMEVVAPTWPFSCDNPCKSYETGHSGYRLSVHNPAGSPVVATCRAAGTDASGSVLFRGPVSGRSFGPWYVASDESASAEGTIELQSPGTVAEFSVTCTGREVHSVPPQRPEVGPRLIGELGSEKVRLPTNVTVPNPCDGPTWVSPVPGLPPNTGICFPKGTAQGDSGLLMVRIARGRVPNDNDRLYFWLVDRLSRAQPPGHQQWRATLISQQRLVGYSCRDTAVIAWPCDR
jgi:hypothetical protein